MDRTSGAMKHCGLLNAARYHSLENRFKAAFIPHLITSRWRSSDLVRLQAYSGMTHTMNVRLLIDPVPPVTIHCIVTVCDPDPIPERNPEYEILENPFPEYLIAPGFTGFPSTTARMSIARPTSDRRADPKNSTRIVDFPVIVKTCPGVGTKSTNDVDVVESVRAAVPKNTCLGPANRGSAAEGLSIPLARLKINSAVTIESKSDFLNIVVLLLAKVWRAEAICG